MRRSYDQTFKAKVGLEAKGEPNHLLQIVGKLNVKLDYLKKNQAVYWKSPQESNRGIRICRW